MKNKRRRRIPYRKYTARAKQDSSFSFFVAVAILLALAYLGAATKAGTFLAEKVVRPVFEQLGVFSGEGTAPEATSSPVGHGELYGACHGFLFFTSRRVRFPGEC